MKKRHLLLGSALVLALGCGSEKGSSQTATQSGTVAQSAPHEPLDAPKNTPLAPGSKFVSAGERNPSIVPESAAEPEVKGWKGTLVPGSVKDTRTKEQKGEPSPMTQDLANKLGGYRFDPSDLKNCQLEITGVLITGPCSEGPGGWTLTPNTVAGVDSKTAAKDPLLAPLAKPQQFEKTKDGFVLTLDGGKKISFKPPSAKSKP